MPKLDVPPALMTAAELRALPLGPIRKHDGRTGWSLPAAAQPYRVGLPPVVYRRRLGSKVWTFGQWPDGQWYRTPHTED